MKKLLMLSLCVGLLSASLTACNTMQGVGQDVQKAGASVENAAKK